MDSKKFEQLINLVINEGSEDQVRALFHDIVVEKSREIYESMMEMDDMEEGLGGKAGDLLDEIQDEEAGVYEADEDMEDEFGGETEDDGLSIDDEGVEPEEDDLDSMGDMDDADMDDLEADAEDGEEDLEDRVVDLEDKLDQLMAEFEELMAGEDDEEAGEEEEASGEEEEEEGEEETASGEEEEEEGEEEEEEAMMEAKLLPVKMSKEASPASHSPARSKPGFQSKGEPVNFTQGSAAGRSTPKVAAGKTYGNTGAGTKVDLKAAPAVAKKPAAGTGSKSVLKQVTESKKTPVKKSK